ncbi:glycosyltransferase family 4 protein [Vibrio cyclitrophicus]
MRIFEVCRELSKYYSVTLLSLCESNDEMVMDIPNDGVFTSVHRVLMPKWKSYLNCVLALPTVTPLQVSYYKNKNLTKLVEILAPEHDLLFSHLIRMADYVKDIEIPKVLEMTDAISMNYSRVIHTKNNAGFKKYIYKVEQSRLKRYERSVAEVFDCNILVSKFDKDYLFNASDKCFDKTLVCSNGVDLRSLPYEFSPSKKEVIFIGNMYSAQNFDAAMWFAEECLPVLREYGEYTFKIIGRIKPEGEQKLKRIDGVVVTGAVDNVVTHARGAIAGICPVRLAAGVQNKILEYMALGLPSITTATGLEGLDSIPGEDILIAETPDEFTKQILRIDNDIEFAMSLSINAFNYVQHNHSWSGKLAPVTITINNLLSN